MYKYIVVPTEGEIIQGEDGDYVEVAIEDVIKALEEIGVTMLDIRGVLDEDEPYTHEDEL